MTVTVMVATIGRPGLEPALRSVVPELREGDQLLVMSQEAIRARVLAIAPSCTFLAMKPGRDWGHSERNRGVSHATGDYLAFLDDDDVFLPGWREAMDVAMQSGKPTIFRMRFPWGGILWSTPELVMGNCGTPCFFLPNDPAKLGTWTPRYGGDFDFIASCKWAPRDYVFDATIIANIRPGDRHLYSAAR